MENLYMNARHVHAVQTLSERPLTKLDALRTLANAYWYAFYTDKYALGAYSAADIIGASFGYVRRSMTLEDLKPAPVVNEGYNGRMPTHF